MFKPAIDPQDTVLAEFGRGPANHVGDFYCAIFKRGVYYDYARDGGCDCYGFVVFIGLTCFTFNLASI